MFDSEVIAEASDYIIEATEQGVLMSSLGYNLRCIEKYKELYKNLEI